MSGFGGFCPLPIRLGGSDTEGWPAAQNARAQADTAASCYALPFAWVTYRFGGDPLALILLGYNGMPGIGTAWRPVIVRITDGHSRVAFAATYSDSYERPEPVALRHAKATAQSGSAIIATTVIGADLASVDVYTFNAAGAGTDCPLTLRVT